MTMNEGMYTSASAEWATPWWLFDALNAKYDFKLDPCATAENAKCEHFFGKEDDGLKRDWYPYGSVFVNPPYGREIRAWIKKASEEATKGCTVVCLLPARTDTTYFHAYIYKKPNVEIEFIKGRIKFEGQEKNNPAPFPSMIVVFHPPTMGIGELINSSVKEPQ